MSDSNGYYDFEEQSPARQEEKKEQFWKGLALGLAVAAAVAVILTVMNVPASRPERSGICTTKNSRRHRPPLPEKRAPGTGRSGFWRTI